MEDGGGESSRDLGEGRYLGSITPGPPQRKMLECIQQNIFADPDSSIIPEDERRGICLLRNVINSNERADIDPKIKSLRVTGTSGLSYLVRPGKGGPHNTRFTVWGCDDEDGSSSRIRDMLRVRGRHPDPPICIVEKPELRRLVIGDAVASVVMALLDDMNSSKDVDTLRKHIFSRRRSLDENANPMMANLAREMDEARRYRDRLMRNGVAERVRRYTESFPTLWGVLLRAPIGERLTFRAIRVGEPNITMDGCDTQFATRNLVERRAVYRMLVESGWIRDGHEEELRGVERVYLRTGTGDRDMGEGVREICQILEPELMTERVQLVQRQLWTFFERANPGPCALLPGSDQLIE